jgi:6-phosphogluconolactonase
MTKTVHIGDRTELRVYADAEQLAHAGAELLVTLAAESIAVRGRFRVALSGGTTPRRVYELLATDAFKDRVDWDKVDLFWGDERYVAADHPDSNYRMAAEALLEHVAVPAINIHRVPTEVAPASAAAERYEEDIRNCFGTPTSVPRFNLIYLGLGPDGHTASLFPHAPILRDDKRLVVADFVNKLSLWRISMTANLLNHGHTVAFLVEGEPKAAVLRDVLVGPRDPEHLPAQLIAPEGNLLWLTDEAAAHLLAGVEKKRSA